MRISIHTLGTRGDMQPYLALGREARRLGHAVLIIGPEQFGSMAAEEGIAFAGLPGEFLELVNSPDAKALIGKSGGGFGAGLKLVKHAMGMMRDLFDREWAGAEAFGPDAILYHPKSLAAPHIAQRLGVPHMLASPLPGFTPTSDFASPILPFASVGPLNWASHALMIHSGNLLFRKTLRTFRSETLGMARGKPERSRGTLYGYSPHVLPRPKDWGDDVAVTGYWMLDTPDWKPDTKLAGFLEGGEAPVYVGFGSMPEADPQQLTRLVIEGLRKAGKRGLLATGGGALATTEAGADMHFIAGAPHDRLFPLVHSVIHHGGAGTTGAALRAGRPNMVCPFFGDQPFWGRQVHKIGAGPAPLLRKHLTADGIAQAIAAMDGAEMRARAAALGAAIEQETGAAAALDFIEARLR